MDKRIIFAVAGSGKTTYILDQLNLVDSSLIITYTNNNYENIRQRIISKWGFIPNNIKLLTYFSFLHSFCFKPLLGHRYKTNGILFDHNKNLFATGDARFISSGNRLYSNRVAKFFDEKGILKEINDRISKYYKALYIDEVQDFGGHDFNFLKSFCKASVNMLMVGDFYQHTFDTSRDGKVNNKLHDDFQKYQKEFIKMGLKPDTTTLGKSYRCSPEICDFITNNLGIKIESHRNDRSEIRIIEDPDEAKTILEDVSIIKLFYQQHYIYNCFSRNWGDSKGEDRYRDVCVVMNKKSYQFFQKNRLYELPPQTKNKLYVACSRPKGDLLILSDQLLKT